MNCLMGGMVAVVTIATVHVPNDRDPSHPAFWFAMSMALLFGAIVAYPMNWWLVAHHLKHGMMTVRPKPDEAPAAAEAAMAPMPAMPAHSMEAGMPRVSASTLAAMSVLSIAVFALGAVAAATFT